MNFHDINITSKHLEHIPDYYFNDLFAALKKISSKLFVYNSPKKFIDNIKKHGKDVVLSIWSGKDSRNRRALIPSICESYNICYVGADTYTHIICQDKALAKEFCRKRGLNTPNYVLVESMRSLELIRMLEFPVVVKPNFEGGSIGISEINLVDNYLEASNLVKKLYDVYKQPILVEEFIRGREVSIIVFGNSKEIYIKEAFETYISGDEKLLKNIIYGFEIKKAKRLKVSLRPITQMINRDVMKKISRIFKLLSKVEIIRFDGRLKENEFFIIELTPDVSIRKDDEFHSAFKFNNISYEEMLCKVVNNAIDFHQSQNANN